MFARCSRSAFLAILISALFFYVAPACSASVGEVQMKSLPETVGLEHKDRIERMARLAALKGITPPKISQIQLEAGKVPGTDFAVPVVRVLFDEGVFFDTNKDTLHKNARKVIQLLAESIKNDVPDVKLLVMGHTDSDGSIPYNIDLSERRAVNIMKMLAGFGVATDSMTAIPIGMAQPIASNATDEGKAQNRRVEFMLSANEKANLQLVTLRRVISDYLPAPIAAQNFELQMPQTANVLSFSTSESGDLLMQSTAEIQLQKPSSIADINLNKPADYKKNDLNDEFVLE